MDNVRINPSELRAEKIPLNMNYLKENPDVKILLVEGESDDFYDNFIEQKATRKVRHIYEKDKEPEFLSRIQSIFFEMKDINKLNLNCIFIKFLILYQLKEADKNSSEKIGKWYGIIDRDFVSKEKIITPDYRKQLMCTDQNDLETTLLFYSYDTWKKYYAEITGINNILDKAIEFASQIGYVRSTYKYINFKKIEETLYEDKYGQLNGYLPFIQIEHNEFSFDFNKYLNRLLPTFPPKKRKKIEENGYKVSNLKYCRGHDIFDFLACFYYKKKLCNEKITKYRGRLEKLIEEDNTSIEKFKESDLFKQLKMNFLND